MKLARAAVRLAPISLVLALGCGDKLVGLAASIQVSPDSLDFGSVAVGATGSVTVSVTNQGSTTLSLSNIAISSDPNGELSLQGLLTSDCSGNQRSGSANLSPGECAQFAVIWTPAGGAHAAAGSVEIDSSDTQNPNITLPVSGNSTVVTCESTCAASGSQCCDNLCVDTQSNPAHCGGCDACAAGDTCVAGVCTPPVVMNNGCDDVTNPCASPDKCCNHVCTDVSATGGVCPCTMGALSNFGVGTIIIPMDVCWQRGKDVTSTPSYCATGATGGSNAKTVGDDSPLKAYGLVFFLIRHQVSVYVIIDPNKTSIDAPDLQMQTLDNSNAVLQYNWGTGQAAPMAHLQTSVQYRGGPFVIDASQHDRVMNLLATDPDFAQFRTAGNITVHVANLGFQSTVAKTINAVPSRIALLSPTSANDDSTYQILVNYLDSAGLNFPAANGQPAAGGTYASHGQIYDRLETADFMPDYDSSNLKAGGYKLLWSPHWEGVQNSNGSINQTSTAAQLATIGAYVNAGGDLFAECAAIGTLEGFSGSEAGGGGNSTGSAATRFMTTNGMAGNNLMARGNSQTIAGPYAFGNLSDVFSQIGDFPFFGFNGAITDFHPASGSAYVTGVEHDISKTSGSVQNDLFTSYDQHAAGKGTVVYLSGHDYSYNGSYSTSQGVTAGSRLVLNTLFSLGTNDVCISQ